MDNNELRGQMYAIQSPSLSEELSGKDAEKMLGWSDTCCWSWTGPWWQSTSCWHSQQEEGMHSAPIAIKPKWKAQRMYREGKPRCSRNKNMFWIEC